MRTRPLTAPTRLLLLLALLLSAPAPASAHQQLLGTSPTEGAILAAVPGELRLTFNQRVEPALASLRLLGPAGEVELGPLGVAPDSSQVMVADVRGGLQPGTYTVQWLVTGLDGHPVRGEYSFTIAPDAAGLAQEPEAGAPAAVEPVAATEHHPPAAAGTFGAESPLYALVRWLTFMALLGVIGAVTFRLLVLRGVAGELAAPAARGAAGVGIGAAALLVVALLLRLYAQSYALHGEEGALRDSGIADMLTLTYWGWGWMLQAAGALAALVGFALARRGAGAGWALAAIGALALSFSPGLSGHAVATPGLAPVALLADALHVLGAGGWLGSLLMVLVVGMPVALRRGEGRPAAVASFVNAFSPVALAFAAVVVATGVFASWLHLGSVPALWQSAYGRTLLLKLAALTLVFGVGAYNWRKVRPMLHDAVAAQRLRRSATLELAVGAAVLAITAFLVATTPPERTEAVPQTASAAEPAR